MSPKITHYLETRFGSTQNGIEFLQFTGWLLCLGTVLPMVSRILVAPVIVLLLIWLFVLGIMWFVVIWKKGWRVTSSPIDAGLAAIFLALLLALYFSPDPSRGMRMVWKWGALIMLFYTALTLFRLGFSFYPFVKALLIVTAVMSSVGYIELFFKLLAWYVQQDFPLALPPSIPRVAGPSGNPNPFGGILAMVFAMAVAVHVEFKQYRSKWLWGWLLITAVMLLATQSRGAWLGLLVAFSLYSVSKLWARNKETAVSRKVWAALLLAILVGIAAIITLLFILRPSTFTSTGTIGIRFELWKAAINGWRESPWVGIGPNIFPTIQLQQIPTPYHELLRTVHNFYLTILIEMGVVGMMAFLFFMGQIVWMLWHHRSRWNGWTTVFFLPLTAYAIHVLVDSPWIQTAIIGAIFLAAIVAILDPRTDEKYPAPRHRLSPLAVWSVVWAVLMITGVGSWRIAKQYHAGINRLTDGDWQAASKLFHEGQELTPYANSLFSYASGFSDGVLAYTDDAYLPVAIANQEELIGLEPGWSAHHANLAGLYRQTGRNDDAAATMEQAIVLSPDVPVYYLNLGLWYEEDGEIETAVSIYQHLYQLSRTWQQSPFWSQPHIAGAMADIMPSHVDDDGNFREVLAKRGVPNGHLQDGIAYLYGDDTENATHAFEEASISHAPISKLWQAALPITPDDALPAAVTALQGVYAVDGRTNFMPYTISVFERESIPHDLLPQISCFTFPPVAGLHMQLLQEWYASQGDVENADYLNAALSGAGNGLVPCTPVIVTPANTTR